MTDPGCMCKWQWEIRRSRTDLQTRSHWPEVRIVDVLRMRDSSGSERRRHSGGCRARRIVAPPAGKIQCGIIIIIMIIIKIIIITTIIIIIISDLGRRITMITARAPSYFSAYPFWFNATMRSLYWVPSPTQPRGRNVAVPALVLAFSLVLALRIYSIECDF